MHKRICYLLFFIALVLPAASQEIDIPDPNLREVIRETLELPGQPITVMVMQELRALGGKDKQIRDITGLEHALNLERLILPDNHITDLRPLARLPRLQHLNLGRNGLKDISPLAMIKSLTELHLHNNHISDIRPLAHLTGLTALVLEDNNIQDVTSLAHLTSLKRLELQNNGITDITPLENLTNLDYLDTQNNPIFDPHSPIVDIPSPNLHTTIREALRLPDGVPITRAVMQRLREIHVKGLPIGDLTGLEHAVNLERLVLSSCNISDVRPLAMLPKLRHLNLGANPLVDISPLATLMTLRDLHLHKCQVVDIRPLSHLTGLVTLALLKNNISDFTPLSNLNNLEYLDIRFNPATDFSPLTGLARVEIRYDELCEDPPVGVTHRLQTRSFPSVFNAWDRISNQPHLNLIENYAQHDLMWGDVSFELEPKVTDHGTWMAGDLDFARERRNRFLANNPSMLFLLEIRMVTFPTWWFPESWPHWFRDEQGQRIEGSGRARVDFAHPEVQDYIVRRVLAVARCGLYDGVFIDHGGEDINALEGRRTHQEVLAARVSILESIRAHAHPEFLIIVNTGQLTIPLTGKYINGLFMETGQPANLLDHGLHPERTEFVLNRIRNTLNWGSEHLRKPHVICLEGGAFRKYPPDHPLNLQYMRLFTTLSLTHSDGYVLFTDGHPGHKHYWYDFWDADLGMPVGEKGQLYQETDGLYIRGVYERLGGVQPQRRSAGHHIAGGGAGCCQRSREYGARLAQPRWRNVFAREAEESCRRERGWRGEYL